MRLLFLKTNKKFLQKPCIPCETYEDGVSIGQRLIFAKHTGPIKKGRPVGIAANQIGINKRVFIALLDGNWECFVNPEIIKKSKTVINEVEGCLSIPGKQFRTMRYEWIKIKSLGKKSKKYTGQNAIIIQHELDHLNGRLCNQGGLYGQEK